VDLSNIPHHWGVVETTALFDRKSPFNRATAEGTQGQGSRAPSLDTPHRDCSRRRLRPNPARVGHLLSRLPPSSLAGVTWERMMPPTLRALARLTQREGRATPDFREEIGRSPTRGAFRRWPFARRTERRLSGQACCPATASSAFFTTKKPMRGTLARALMARSLGQGRAANRPVAERPQRPLTTSAFE
jgi:hypothetical protein